MAARIGNAGGVVIGLGEGEMFIASDLPAILEHTRRVVFLESRQMAVVTREGVHGADPGWQAGAARGAHVAWDPVAAEKGEYRHFMQKEIHEQVRSLTDTIAGRVDFENGQGVRLPELNLTPELAQRIQKIFITACGTAAHAGMVGKVLIEHIARIPVEVDIASEFRYRDPIVDEDTVVLAISQSGETADTLAAMEEGAPQGRCAVVDRQRHRLAGHAHRRRLHLDADRSGDRGGLHQGLHRAAGGPVHAGDAAGRPARRRSTRASAAELVADLRLVPDLVGRCLDREAEVEKVARALMDTQHCLYLGRGINMPTAYEGALKLKEISYIHAEGYPAGEMKHGPIALIDRDMPVVVIAPA